MTESVVDVLARVQQANQNIGVLLVELLNHPDPASQAQRVRELGQHLGALSAECLGRAAEMDGRAVEPPEHVVIDARS